MSVVEKIGIDIQSPALVQIVPAVRRAAANRPIGVKHGDIAVGGVSVSLQDAGSCVGDGGDASPSDDLNKTTTIRDRNFVMDLLKYLN